MNLGSFKQQPVEKLDYDINYANWLTENDGLDSAIVTVEPADGLDVSPFVSTPRVKVWVAGGVSGVAYKITLTVRTDDGRVKQDEFTVKVKDT